MRTISDVLADLRVLATKQAGGADVSAERRALEAELASLGVSIAAPTTAGQTYSQEQVDAAVRHAMASTRSGSRFAGDGADPEVARHLAAGGSFALDGTPIDGDAARFPAGSRVDHRGADRPRFIRDILAAKAGDPGAQQRMVEASKEVENGAFLISEDLVPGYIAQRSAAGPVRALCTQHEATGRFIRVVLEGDGELVVEAVPEGGTKPISDTAIDQIIELAHKSAGVTTIPDELIADSGGAAEEIVAAKFARAMGKDIDSKLLNGTGAGEVLGVLRDPTVDQVPVGGQSAMALYASVVTSLYALRGRYFDNISVVLHPLVLKRFDLATNANGEFAFPDGLQGKLGQKARVVEDDNLPIAAGNVVPILVGDLRQVHFFSRQALTIESDRAPGFQDDTTMFRAVERYAALLAKPSGFQVLTGTDLDLNA